MSEPEGAVHVAIAGATGAVGVELLRVLARREFPVRSLTLLASSRSAGQTTSFRGREVRIGDLAEESFAGIDVAFFSCGGDVSLEHAPRAAGAGALVIDNSSAFRRDPNVPLVVPQVNGSELEGHRGIVANPNCSTILLVMVLAPLEAQVPIRRVVCSTYQAVSGSGAKGLRELEEQSRADADGRGCPPRVYPKPICGNVLPFVQGFGEDGLTVEEWKLVHETRRLLGRPEFRLTATCARVPVKRAHSEAVNVEFEREVTPEEVATWLGKAPGVRVVDDPTATLFPTPRDAEGQDDVLVGRIRRDPSHVCAVDLWLTGDQLLKGAALNAVEIAESAIGRRP